MANDLILRSSDLQTLISSPECVALRRISLGTVNHPGMPTRKYLAGGLKLTDEKRAEIRQVIDHLRGICFADSTAENRKAQLGLVASMLLAYPVAGGSAEAGKARAEAYLFSLDDLPPWAIQEAIRLWHRGECGSGFNYRWAPAPAELRQISVDRLKGGRDTVAHLEEVLAALTLERAMDHRPIEKTGNGLPPFSLKVIR